AAFEAAVTFHASTLEPGDQSPRAISVLRVLRVTREQQPLLEPYLDHEKDDDCGCRGRDGGGGLPERQPDDEQQDGGIDRMPELSIDAGGGQLRAAFGLRRDLHRAADRCERGEHEQEADDAQHAAGGSGHLRREQEWTLVEKKDERENAKEPRLKDRV